MTLFSLSVTDADAMEDLGRRIGSACRAGDLVILDGPLGAGKTTLARGIGDALRVRGPITSPTFVISRIHPSLDGGASMIHVDAYRLADAAEIDDLDLDSAMPDAVTVVEWGAGRVEGLASDPLILHFTRDDTDIRVVTAEGGPRWQAITWNEALAGLH
jgi:tRNA threonylcarbamoyladenosine biosynthesis protein TsaE